MRSVFHFGIMLLVVLGLLNLTLEAPASGLDEEISQPLSLLVGSRGHMLPGVPMEGGEEFFDEAFAIGDLLLTPGLTPPGLRLAVLRPGLEFRNYTTYDTANDPNAGRKLGELLDDLPRGALIIAAVEGLVQPADGDSGSLDKFAQGLGAEFTPFREPSVSWAIISYKLKSGWRTLAEAYSESRGVHLVFTVSPDPKVYSGFRSEVFFAPSDGPQELSLFECMRSGKFDAVRVKTDKWAALNGVRNKSIVSWPLPDDSARVLWEQVPLGSDPKFTVSLGARGGGDMSARSITAILRIQGEEVARSDPGPLPGKGWLPWSVDLSAYANQSVTVEFVTEVSGSGPSVAVLWGAPTIHWGDNE